MTYSPRIPSLETCPWTLNPTTLMALCAQLKVRVVGLLVAVFDGIFLGQNCDLQSLVEDPNGALSTRMGQLHAEGGYLGLVSTHAAEREERAPPVTPILE